VIEETTAGLSPDEIEAMKNSLRHIRSALSERNADPQPVAATSKPQRRNVK
jgi:hypothetical protein